MAQYEYTCPKCGTFHETTYSLRSCSNANCLEPFISEAGKLKQKYIVFFGTPTAGKRSAMVALAVHLCRTYTVQPLDPANLEEVITNFQNGKLDKKPATKTSDPYSFTLYLRTAPDHEFLLTLVSIPWNYKASSPMFPHPCAYVLCWDTKADGERQRFNRELYDLRWDLKKPGSESEEPGWTSDFKDAQLESFNAFVEKIRGDFSPPSDFKTEREYLISNLIQNVHSLQYKVHSLQDHASEKQTPPILLLYNKYDTIPEEELRITPREDTKPEYQKLLWKEIQACGNDRYFPALNELSSTFTTILDQKFLHNCFYAQMRFSPYGSDVPSLAVPEIMRTRKHITSAIDLYLRLQLYALQYKRTDITDSDKTALQNAIEKYALFSHQDDLPRKYRVVIRETAKTLLAKLHSGTYFKSDYDRIYDAHRRAKRNAQLVRYQIDCIKNHRKPAPQNTDLLCQWLLYVSGILSVPPKNVRPAKAFSQDKAFFLQAPEYRSKSAAEQHDLDSIEGEIDVDTLRREAAARLYLFENPHDEDIKYLSATKNTEIKSPKK